MVNHFAKISNLQESVFYSPNSNFAKIDWNWDDIGAHLNDQYWYEDDFMRSFTLLIASQKTMIDALYSLRRMCLMPMNRFTM